MPLGPLRTEGWNGMSVVGAVSRSVRDSAAFLDAVSGLEPGARYDSTHVPGGFRADGLPADGQSVVKLTLRLFDRNGQPLATDATVTIEHSGGRLRLPGGRSDESGPRALDADRATPGVQWRVHAGVAEVELIAPAEAQDVRVRVSAGGELAQGVLHFVPDLRPMIAVGLLEGIVSFRHRATLEPVRRGDAFEQEIVNWSLLDFPASAPKFDNKGRFYPKSAVLP